MEDTYRHKGMRKRLLDEIQAKYHYAPKVIEAMYKIPRHFFLDGAFEEFAYTDKAFPIDEQQTISQPSTVAYQTHLLDISPRQHVLEIGTGSGYQAAVLAAIGARVYTVERHEQLHLKAKTIFDFLSLGSVRAFFGDGSKGLGEFAPFDRILVTAATSSVPPALLKQLIVGGKLVIPVGNTHEQKMHIITRTGNHDYETSTFGRFKFVPLLRGKNYKHPNN
ncbi:MAG: protein-L-isoaspartate(D-aspartate) O-methyltransferase [Saprospiraceae bacterium]|nr:protein-L-isoaspartate(D-aspartate) O-methyltransferase [Saprospiraceae bacterium]